MDFDPDYIFDDDPVFEDPDQIVDEEGLSADPDCPADVFPDGDDIALAGAFADLIQDEEKTRKYDLGRNTDRENYLLARSMCTASGEPRREEPTVFEDFVDYVINTPGYFRRRKS